MAKAKLVQVEPEIQLTLTEQEAVVLYAILGNVGGATTGPRGLMSGYLNTGSVYAQLKSVVPNINDKSEGLIEDPAANLMLVDEWPQGLE